MPNKNDPVSYLKEIMDAELKDPAALARLAAKNAEDIMEAVTKLGTVGSDNTVYSEQLMNATVSQIEQIQKLHGLPSDLPFQKTSYQVPEIEDAPLQNEGDIQSQVETQTVKAETTNMLTKQALKDKQGFLAIPLIGNTVSEWVKSTNQYLNTNLLAQKADVKAKESMNK